MSDLDDALKPPSDPEQQARNEEWLERAKREQEYLEEQFKPQTRNPSEVSVKAARRAKKKPEPPASIEYCNDKYYKKVLGEAGEEIQEWLDGVGGQNPTRAL